MNTITPTLAYEPPQTAPALPAVDFSANPVAVIIPAYNEERFIGSVVLKLLQRPLTVIVVDDGSSDDTALVARLAGAQVIRHPCNQGKGQALNTGIRLARELHPHAIVMIDADGQHLPEQLADLVRPILLDQADLVVGSRYLRPAPGTPRHRRLGHWFFNRLNRLASGVAVSDSQSGYRAFSPRAYNTDLFHSSDFSVESEMQFLARQHGLRVAEVPVTIRYTDKPKRPVWQHGLVVLNGVLRLTGQYRPLLFFGLPGAILILIGFIAAAWVVQRYLQVQVFAIGTALSSLLVTMIGLVSLSTGIILHSVRGLLIDLLASKPSEAAQTEG
jgi:glycosyltransferase involved in cell wall biosynthesis